MKIKTILAFLIIAMLTSISYPAYSQNKANIKIKTKQKFSNYDLLSILLQNRLSSIDKNSCYPVSMLQIGQVLQNGVLAKVPDFIANDVHYSYKEFIYIQMDSSELADGEIIESFYLCPIKTFSYNSSFGRRTVKAFRKVD